MNMKKMMLTAVFALALMGMVFSMPVLFVQDGEEKTDSEILGANPVAPSVTLFTSEEVGIMLSDTLPYLVDGASSVSGDLNGGECKAYFEAGTLTLWNFSGYGISSNNAAAHDLTIKLIGDNNVDGEIYLIGGGDLAITADDPASLTVTHTWSGGSGAYAVSTDTTSGTNYGAITIGGKANVKIDVTNEDTDYRNAYGIYAKQGVTIEDDASVDITAVTRAPNSSYAYGIYSGNQGIIINTTGNVIIDCSGTKNNGVALYFTTLKAVSFMSLKYTGGGGAAHAGTLTFDECDEDDFIIEGDRIGKGIMTFQHTTMKFVSDGLNVPAGDSGTSITMINAASGVTGGVAPFIFEKIDGPSWLEISADGEITGTRPVTYREATTAEIRVTDDEGAYREITIEVGEVSGPKPAARVDVNNNQGLGQSYPYLVNGSSSRTGELNGIDCTAHFDYISGTLTLWNYEGGKIVVIPLLGEASELTIVLIGTNTITFSGTSLVRGIDNNHFGSDVNITITSETGGSLDICVTNEEYTACGIDSPKGDVTLSGDAVLTMNVTSEGTGFTAVAYGIYTGDNLYISDDVSLIITARTTSTFDGSATGIVADTVYVDTTGDVTIDTSGSNCNTYALCAYTGIELTKVGMMTLEWSNAGEAVAPWGGALNYDPSYFIVDRTTPNVVTYEYSTTIPLTFVHSEAFDIPASVVDEPIAPIDVSGGAWGGRTPYTFTAEGLPAGLSISAYGVISGTPTTNGAAGTATIRVTDGNSDWKEITIDFGVISLSITFTAEQTGGTIGTADSTGIVITFSTDVAGLSADNITIAEKTGSAVKGGLSGSGKTYTIALISVSGAGNVEVSVTNFGTFIVTNTETVAVHKHTVPPALSAGSVDRTSDTAATINFTTDEAGTAYYLEMEAGSRDTAGAEVISEGTSLGSVTVGVNTGMAVTLGDWLRRDIFVVVVDSAGNISDLLKITANWLPNPSAEAIEGVTSPAANATPSTAIDDGTTFTTNLTWNGSPGTFGYSTSYTATITLTANSGYTFSGSYDYPNQIAGFTVNGITPTSIVSNTGAQLVFTVTFPATSAAPLEGTATISNTSPRIGDVLTGSLEGGNNSGTLMYQWKVDGTPSGTNPAYTVTTANLGKVITLVITSTMQTGEIVSSETSPVAKKLAPSAPGAPTMSAKTDTSITLNAIAGAEYRLGTGGTWQTSRIFTELTPSTDYTFYARIAETPDTLASAESAASAVIATNGIVTVVNGTGSGNFAAGDPVLITADTAVFGYTFDKWESDDVTVANTVSTTFTMPAKNVTVTAVYKELPIGTYNIDVQNDGNGTANATPTYAIADTEITLTAIPNAGYRFKEWQVTDDVVIITADKFTMPAQGVTIAAIFELIVFTVTVENGTGGGDYAPDVPVTITAGTAPTGKEFDCWTTADGMSFASAGSEVTTFVMPSKNVTVTATYKDVLYTVTYDLNVGSGTAPTQTDKKYNETFGAAEATGMTAPDGKQFKQWNTAANGSGTVYAVGATVTMPAAALTLYAIWEDIPATGGPVDNGNGGTDTVVIVAIVAVIAIAGGGAAVYFLFIRKP